MSYSSASRRLFLGKTTAAVAGLAFLSSQKTLASILNNPAPFDGYNEYSEEKSDLRKGYFTGKSLVVSGKVFNNDGSGTIANALIEIWHLSPGSDKFRHRGHFFTDDQGKYSFKTDFPNRTEGKKPRIYFRSSVAERVVYTELILDNNNVYIHSTHWEKHNLLNDKLFPKMKKSPLENQVQFNFTI